MINEGALGTFEGTLTIDNIISVAHYQGITISSVPFRVLAWSFGGSLRVCAVRDWQMIA